MNSAAPSSARLRTIRIAISVAFFCCGLAVGLWFTHVPSIAARLALEPHILGLALLSFGITGLIMQTPSGLLIARYGSRRVGRITLPLFMLGILAPIVAPNLPVFVASLVAVSILATPSFVAANTQAAEFEAVSGRAVMSSFHGFFSVGSLVVALVAGALIGAGYGDGRGAAVVALVAFAAALWAVFNLLETAPKPPQAKAPGQTRNSLAAIVSVAGLAIVAILCTTVEGSVGDWSGIYLSTVKNSGAGLSAAGFAMFSLAMAACRFAGGPIVERLGNRTVVTGGGILIAIGMAVVVLTPWPLVSAMGYLVVAAGAANVTPLLSSAAARTPGISPSVAISGVSTALTIGLLGGPPIIGFISKGFGLDAGMAFIGLLGVVIAVAAWSHRWQPAPVAAE
jgi:MFS family permease